MDSCNVIITTMINSDTVMLIMRQFDEEGVKLWKKNLLKRRVYLSKVRPNNNILII